MAKIRIEIDLLKLKGAHMDGNNLVIPCNENAIQLRNKKDGTCFSIFKLNVFSRKEVGQFNETHILKNSLTEMQRNELAAGKEIDNPIIGNIKQYE